VVPPDIKSREDLMKNILNRSHLFFLKIFERLSSRLYVPSQTGSHSLGEQYMGDVASTYIEHKNFPGAARSPFISIVLSKRK
jgi:hypothetical protein